MSGGRLYRTGDRARYLADGNLEFLGRLDQQVKLRAYRIELGEIEATLREHAGVREAVVVVREDTPGDRRLAAYVIAKADGGLEVAGLRDHLRERLPEYMVPSGYVVLERFPLTANGKLDRRALPAPEAGDRSASADYVAPRTEIERSLCQIWADLLHIERVGIRENFFDLGGDSILATRMATRVRQSLGLVVHVRLVFEHPTIEGFSESLQRAAAAAAREGPMSDNALPRRGKRFTGCSRYNRESV